MIEQDDSNSLIVAATNHAEILDYAVFRRFDDVIEYALPDSSLAVETLKARLGSFVDGETDWETLARSAQSLSYADLVRAADDAIKDVIINDRDKVCESELRRSFEERQAMRRKQR